MTRSRWLSTSIGTMAMACGAMVLSAAGALAAPPGTVSPGIRVQKAFPPSYSLPYQLTCGAYMMTGGVIYKVAVVNTGPGTVPIGTKIHWNMNVQPGGNYQGDYTFTSQLSSNGRMWVPSLGLPLSFNSAPCTVTVL
jgi:hypothetical protein